MVEAVLGGLHPVVEPVGGVLHVVRKRLELRLQRGRVRDEVLPALTEHGALVGADAAEAEGEDDAW